MVAETVETTMSFWLIPLIILVGMAGITILNAFTYPRLKPGRPKQTPLVSIIVPARNEAQNIERVINNLLEQDYPNLEILVVDDQSEDATAQMARDAAAGDPRFQLISGKPLPDTWIGKNWACHQAAQQANGEILIFTDADVRWQPEAISAILKVIENTKADLLTVWPKQIASTFSERMVIPMMTFTVLSYLPELAVRYVPFKSLAAATGQCLVFRREAYQKIGGHAAIKSSVIDDMSLAWNIKRSRRRFAQALSNGFIETHMYSGWSAVRDGFAKNIMAGHSGKPILLLASAIFHWTLFLLPWLWLLIGQLVPNQPTGWATFPIAMILLAILIRVLTAHLAKDKMVDAFLLPISIILMTIIAVQGLIWHLRGTATWKGRTIKRL